MFAGPFREGEEQATTLEEINGVVTPRSLEILVQWVCLGRVVFRECAPDIAITTTIELARLADMCRITAMESLMAEHIKTIILASKSGQWAEPLNALPECFRALLAKSLESRDTSGCCSQLNVRRRLIYAIFIFTTCTS
jgi:hypothetical protein